MLVLTRRAGEKIWITDRICITVLETTSGRTRVGIEAPRDLRITKDNPPSPTALAPKEPPTNLPSA